MTAPSTNNHSKVILSTAYFPPVSYFRAIAGAEEVFLENSESFQKQTYRTRCAIYSCNGPIVLTLPVEKAEGVPITDVKVDYFHPWLIRHERAIVSAYSSSAFFEYYRDDVFDILHSKEETLFGLNTRMLRLLLELAGVKKDIKFTDDFVKTYEGDDVMDLRKLIHPKRETPEMFKNKKPYYQVFSEKYGFLDDLSILDLLFNEGPNSISYLL